MSAAGAPEPRERACAAMVLPAGIVAAVAGRRWHRDLVGEAGAAVYRLAGPDGDLFLKHGRGPVAGDVRDELARLVWLGERLPVPALVGFQGDADEAWLLTRALPGRTAYQVLTEADAGERTAIVAALAGFMRRLHAIPAERCPFNADHRLRLAQAQARLEAELVDEEDFGADHAGWSARAVWDAALAEPPGGFERVVTHGDFSLDNLLMDGGAVTGCIDLGRVGIADPYQDLAILHDSLAEFGDEVAAAMWPAYGIAEPDEARRRFHLALDEFF